MSINKELITADQRDELLFMDEFHFADLKSIDIKPAKLTRTIAAFANADGGELFIGIDETEVNGSNIRIWRGFSNMEAANGHIQAFEQLFPLGNYFTYDFLICNGCNGLVLKVNVSKSREIKRASDGKVYVRRSGQNMPFETDEQLRRLHYDKGLASFETETLDVDLDRVVESEITARFLPYIASTHSPDKWLKKQFLIRDGKPTVAAILLFDDEPQALLPKRCGIKVYRYKTPVAQRDSLAFDPITIEGCLYDQINMSVAKTKEIIEDIQILTPQGFGRVSYPEVTLHEIITNAVLHRDYSIASDIHIRIFDNRIEIESPGKLAGHVTIENILNQQFARNGSIVRLIHKFPNPPNKDVGEGLNAAFEAMVNMRLKEPDIVEGENSLIVRISHERLDSPAELIAEYLKYNDEIKNSRAREICHIGSENVMYRIFERMVGGNIIERVPGKLGNATSYRLVKS